MSAPKLNLVIGGQAFELTSLSPEMDKAFADLHAGYFGGRPLEWQSFHRIVRSFFDTILGQYDAHNSYFNNFTLIWQSQLNARYREAEQIWKMALEPAFAWESANPGSRIHKGTPFYFWGMSALLRGDLDEGYCLMHQAVEEDVIASPTGYHTLPGFALVSLDYQNVDQAFRPWVLGQAEFLNRRVERYAEQHERPLTLQAVRDRFLQRPPTRDALFLLAYSIARLMNLNRVEAYSLKNGFAGQLELNVLFDLVLVIDSACRPKTNAVYFNPQAAFLLGAASDPLSGDDLGAVGRDGNFERTLSLLLDAGYVLPSGKRLSRIQADVSLALVLRNHSAHNVSSCRTVWERFDEIQQSLFNTLFATVDYLYP